MADEAKLAFQWSLAAMQLEPGKQNQNLIAFNMNGADCLDRLFQLWATKQVSITLGAPPTMPVLQQNPGVSPTLDSTALNGIMSAQFDTKMASKTKHSPGALGATPHQSQQMNEELGKKVMDKNHLASLMGFIGIEGPTKVITIWKKWQRTTKFWTHCCDLLKAVKAWGKNMGIEVDPCSFFTKQQI